MSKKPRTWVFIILTPWWRHQVETFSAILALCAGNSPVTGEFPSQSPVTRYFDVFFHLCLNKRLSRQSWGWWFDTPSRVLWRHCNVSVVCIFCIFQGKQSCYHEPDISRHLLLQAYGMIYIYIYIYIYDHSNINILKMIYVLVNRCVPLYIPSITVLLCGM